jgi:hypothetical protein
LAQRDAQPESSSPRYEVADVSPLLLFVLACLMAVCIAGVLLAVRIGYPSSVRTEERGTVAPFPPQPRLETAPRAHLVRYRAAKQRELEASGKNREPIDAAMRDTAKQGWGRQ